MVLKAHTFFILILAFPAILCGQEKGRWIIKTHPMRDFLARNPNLGFEKELGRNFSFEFEATYKFYDWERRGSYGLFAYTTTPCRGFRLITAGKKYFPATRNFPNAWFIAAQLGIRYIHIPDFKHTIRDEDPPADHEIMDINKMIFDFNFLFGRQFRIYRNLLSEFNVGWGIYWIHRTRFNIRDYTGTITGEPKRQEKYFQYLPYLNWTVGYMIPCKKKNNNPNKNNNS